MSHKSSQLLDFFSLILKKYQEVRKELQTKEAYRVIQVNQRDSGECFLKIQIIGTGKEVEFTPQEIVSDDTMIEGFSKKDIRTITYFACKDLKKPQIKIIGHSFSEYAKKIIFKMKKLSTSEILQKTADEISSQQTLISSLSPTDAHRIGYTYGSENVIEESQQKEKVKRRKWS